MRRKVYIFINVNDLDPKGPSVYSTAPPLGARISTTSRFWYSPSWIPNTDDFSADPLLIRDIQDITIGEYIFEPNKKFNIAPPSYIKVVED